MRPTRKNIKPGDWLVLRNGWVVGPVVETCFDDFATYVAFGDGTWQVDTIDQPDTHIGMTRFVMFAGSLQQACAYRQQIDLADQTIAEIIAEEQAL